MMRSALPLLLLAAVGNAYTTLQSGLGGAIGSHYVEEESRVYFVEYDGKFSSYDLVPRVEGSNSLGYSTFPPQTSLNLMTGASGNGGHIRWDTALGGVLLMRGQGNCRLAGLKKTASYWSMTAPFLDTLTYTSTLDSTYLQAGMVFGVKNNYRQAAADFDFAKVYVSSYSATSIKLLVTTYQIYDQYKIHGTGYNNPEDVVITAGRQYAYVTERNGNFLRVRMSYSNKDRSGSAVTVLQSGLGALHQISLNDEESVAYVVEYGASGRLLALNLLASTVTTVKSGLSYAVGLVTRGDGNEAFITLQGATNKIMYYVADAGTTEYLPFTLGSGLFFMTWADADKQELFVAQRNYNKVHLVSTNAISDATYHTVGSVPGHSASVAVLGPNDVVVCTDDHLVKLQYNTAYTAAGPLLLGVGHVPKTSIAYPGYATTDPGYFFQVKDAPFGGRVNVMVNHERAKSIGANYYRVWFGSTIVTDPFSDYKWVGDKFVLTTTTPYSGEFFPVRRNEDLWYNAYLGGIIDTTKHEGGTRYIVIRFYTSASSSSYISGAYDYVPLFVDNNRPTASIDAIYQVVNGVNQEVPTCGIVTGTDDGFSFDLTVSDWDGNLLSWTMNAVWGDNKSKFVASDTYDPHHVDPSKKWHGGSFPAPPGNWHATVGGDPTSRRCAHTFYLRVWDRTINGYNHIHRTVVTKSITLLLD